MKSVKGKTALVTGATRGVGKGVALELAESGAIVYATGRTAAEETVTSDGLLIPARCDHTSDAEVEAVFDRIVNEQGRLDILVNSLLVARSPDWLPTRTSCGDQGKFLWRRPWPKNTDIRILMGSGRGLSRWKIYKV